MYIITGGAGFIGSALVWELNNRGIEDIIIADHLGTGEKWKNLMRVVDEPLVSTDIVGERIPSIIDAKMVKVIDKKLVKFLAWYDNEEGYTYSLVVHVIKAGLKTLN